MCREGASWDNSVPNDLASKWRKWRFDIANLHLSEVKRCLKPQGFGSVEKFEMHNFSDSSEVGYGTCSYVRIVNDQGGVHCPFLMGKVRVIPLKQITIPRLELNAAVVSVKMSEFLKEELKYDNVLQYYWVDSKVVLGYVQNEVKTFHTSVANRVQQIRDLSNPNSWLYIESQSNPSDAASRGLSVSNLIKLNWLHGPTFLWEKHKA